MPVQMAPDCVGTPTLAMAKALQPGQVLLLENLRFHKEEEKNGPEFSRQLAELAEVGINDAFGVSHRAHGFRYVSRRLAHHIDDGYEDIQDGINQWFCR